MCGIVATWGVPNRQLTGAMMKSLVHRGPDGEGMAELGRASLGHRRLAIMDPEGGRQPLYNEKRSCGIVANGEIYNFSPLKNQLLESGHRFSTSSDSEVPVHLFEQVGLRTASQLDGMFAFILSDGQQIMAVRDPLGIKPLYYGESGKSLVFASELKALAGRAGKVREFPPGTLYHSRAGFRKYHKIRQLSPTAMSAREACRRLRGTLENAIHKRLMSDVPLGAFLSGGLDSSIIAAVVRRQVRELHTFSVGIEGSRDLAAARLVAEHIDSIHHEHVFSLEEIQQCLPEIIYSLESFDQDLVRSAIPCHFVSRLAARHVKVVLTGEGADELFGGYAYYKDYGLDMPLHEELYRSVCSLHNINLQRVDRMTMAHSLEGRVPFLDLAMIELGQQIPVGLKIRPDQSGKPVEKWILRKAFEDLLPPEIVWRGKEQFDEGSGSSDILPRIGDYFLPSREAAEYRAANAQYRLRSHEESAYHRILCQAYGDPATILDNMARWQDHRLS